MEIYEKFQNSNLEITKNVTLPPHQQKIKVSSVNIVKKSKKNNSFKTPIKSCKF